MPAGVVFGAISLFLLAAFAPKHDTPQRVLNGGHGCFFALRYTPDGRGLFGLTEFGVAEAWTEARGAPVAAMDTHAAIALADWQYGRQRPIADVSSASGRAAWATPASGGLSEVRVLDLQRRALLVRRRMEARSVALAPRGDLLAVETADEVAVMAVDPGNAARPAAVQTLCALPLGDLRGAARRCLAWSDDGARLAIGADAVSVFPVPRIAASPPPQAEVRFPLGGHEAEWLAFLPRGAGLVVASHPPGRPDDAEVSVYGFAEGRATRTAQFSAPEAEQFALSGDGAVILTASSPFRKSVSARQLRSGRLLRRWRPRALLSSVIAISPDGTQAATVQARGVVDLWSIPPAGGAR